MIDVNRPVADAVTRLVRTTKRPHQDAVAGQASARLNHGRVALIAHVNITYLHLTAAQFVGALAAM